MMQTAGMAQTTQAAKPAGQTAATLGAVGLVVALAGSAVYIVGRKVLAPPDLAEPGTWERWFVTVGPVVAVFTVGRILLLAVSALWAFTAVSLACASLGGPGRRVALLMVGLLRRLHLPGNARMFALTVGLSVSAAALGACGAGSPSSASPPAPVLVNPAAGPVSTVLSPTSTAAPASSRAAPIRGSATAPPPRATSRPKPVAPAVPSTPTTMTGGLWVVRPGDDLWSIAAQTIQLRLGRQPDRAEIAAYWLEVIATNRNRLPRPDDPSLLYPGDLIELPAS